MENCSAPLLLISGATLYFLGAVLPFALVYFMMMMMVVVMMMKMMIR